MNADIFILFGYLLGLCFLELEIIKVLQFLLRYADL
jgi:hypothetical protein